MQWYKVGRLLAVCGMLMMIIGVSVLPAHGADLSRDNLPLLAPSPRPTLAPERRGGGADLPPAMGRLTGTVLEQPSGAPKPGVPVNIGGTVIVSDANGNYDVWLLPGTYTVTVELDSSQLAMPFVPLSADIVADQTTVLHVNYATALQPTEVPAAEEPTAEPTPEPVLTATTEETPVPIEQAQAAPPAEGPSSEQVVSRLPRTSSDGNSAWLWVSFGMILLIGGVALEYNRSRRLAIASANRARTQNDNARLLDQLLTKSDVQAPRKAEVDNDPLLSALLTGEQNDNNK